MRLKTATAPRLHERLRLRRDVVALEGHVRLRDDHLHGDLALDVDVLGHRRAAVADVDERRGQRLAGDCRWRQRHCRFEHDVAAAGAERRIAQQRTSHDSGSQNAVVAGCVIGWTLMSVSAGLAESVGRPAGRGSRRRGSPRRGPTTGPVPISGDLRLSVAIATTAFRSSQDRGTVELGALRFSRRQRDRSWAARADDDRRGRPPAWAAVAGRTTPAHPTSGPCRGPGRRPAPRPRSPCTGERRWRRCRRATSEFVRCSCRCLRSRSRQGKGGMFNVERMFAYRA